MTKWSRTPGQLSGGHWVEHKAEFWFKKDKSFKFIFQKVLRFQIWLHLDNFSSSFLFQKYNLGLKNVNFENNDILFYLF